MRFPFPVLTSMTSLGYSTSMTDRNLGALTDRINRPIIYKMSPEPKIETAHLDEDKKYSRYIMFYYSSKLCPLSIIKERIFILLFRSSQILK